MLVPPTREDPVAAAASEAVGGPHGRRSAGHPWWTPVRVVLALTCGAWLLAMAQKAPCAADGWTGEDSRFAQLCYSDIPYLYVGRGFAERVLPYSDTDGRYPDLEYPVLTGWFAYAGALATQALNGWPDLEPRRAADVGGVGALPGVEAERRDSFWVTAALLAPFALAAAWLLAGAHRRRPWDAVAFAVSPALVLTGLVNWDLLPVVCVAGAFWAWGRGRPLLAGVAIGLGTAAKLYPLFLLGALLVVALRRRELRRFLLAGAAALASWCAANAPAWAYGFEGWRGFWTFNADRGPDLGSLWLLFSQAGHPASAETVNRVSLLVFALSCLAVLALGLRAQVVPRWPQLAFLVVAAFLLVNKVYSPQYVLWLLPLAVLARPRWRDLLVWQAGEAFYFVMVWMYLGSFTAPAVDGAQDWAYGAAILVRVAAELWLVAVVVRDVLRPEGDPVRRTAVAAGEDLDADPAWPVTPAAPRAAATVS